MPDDASDEDAQEYNNNDDNSLDNIDNDDVTTNEPSNDKYVYWTPNGKSYHSRKSCPTLSRSKTILEGTDCPKNDPCNICN